MHYYIDGYNLLFRLLRAGDDLRKKREDLTIDLETKINVLEIDATLVFDSHYQEDDNTRSHYKSLEIIFTAPGETADEYILQELKESQAPSQHTVVTSDKILARRCQLRLGKTESVDEFITWINKRYKNRLRQRKAQAKLLANPPTPKAAPPPKEPHPNPAPTDTAEHCFDYYLETFEQQSIVLEAEHPRTKRQETAKKESAKQKTKKPQKKTPQTPEEARLSDTQRWLQAFENTPADENKNL